MLVIVAATPVQADELPLRKPGLWEMTAEDGMYTEECTDATVDKMMMQGERAEKCRSQVRKTAAKYIYERKCADRELSIQLEYSGDFNSAYKKKVTAGGTSKTIAAKWLGACRSDQKPGNIIHFKDPK